MVWCLWTILGLGPLILLLYLDIRALKRCSNSVWADLRDTETLLQWIIPALSVLAAVPLSLSHVLSPIRLALFCVIPIAVFETVLLLSWLGYWREKIDNKYFSVKLIFLHYLGLMGPVISIALYFIFTAFTRGSKFTVIPDVRLSINILIASWIGWYLMYGGTKTSDSLPGKWQLLAPCELFTRIREIASEIGTKIDTVRIVTDIPFNWAGGMASNPREICLTEDLIRKFTKEEVDAVVAHEAGHTLHEYYWWLYMPLSILAWLIWFAGMFLVEKWINALPESFGFLHYVQWMLIFLVPKLVYRSYMRHNEQMANSKLVTLKNPRAAISSNYKLTLVDNIDTHRPWWSKAISTHPSIEEEIKTAALMNGISDKEVEEIKAAVRDDLENGESDRYELVFHNKSSEEVLKRPTLRKFNIAYGVITVIGLAALFGSFALISESQGWIMGIKLIASIIGVAALIAGLSLWVEHWKATAWKSFMVKLYEKLSSEYESADNSMLLVDTITLQDSDRGVWQGALIGPQNDELIILGETSHFNIKISSITSIASHGGSFSSEPEVAVVWYKVEDIPHWAMFKTIGKPEKGLPKSAKQIEKWLLDRFSGMNMDITKRKKKTRISAPRAIVAILILAAITGLTCFLINLTGCVYICIITIYLAAAFVINGLWSWVTGGNDWNE